MPADASIFNALSQPRRSAFDYANAFEQQDNQRQANALQLQSAQLQNQQASLAAADEQAYRKTIAGLGPTATQDDTIAGLMSSGNPLAIRQAQAMQKAKLDADHVRAQTAQAAASGRNSDASAAKTAFETQQARTQQHLSQLVGVQDVPGALAWLDEAQASGELPPDRVAAAKAQLQANPQGLNQWKQAAIAGGFTIQQQRENEWREREFGLKANNELIGPDGKVNYALVGAKKGIAQAGKTSVNLNVNTEKNLTQAMAEGLGKQLDGSLAGAQSAVATINTAKQISDLVGSGKIITGPMADKRLTLARLGETLGVTGADTQEKLSNTAALMQQMAKAELDAAQAMRGQGQITESERSILRRVASGDLNMTAPELKTLAGAMDRTARARIAAHQAQVKKFGGLNGAAPLTPFYEVEAPDGGQSSVEAPQPTQRGGSMPRKPSVSNW